MTARLKDKRLLIVGAATGIGKAIAAAAVAEAHGS
jgi:NAD(P)-dependent dehydrogenase (short-subunit alcohol dehydrogenase family)